MEKTTNVFKIDKAEPEDAISILELQKLGYQAEAELYDDYTIPPLHQTVKSLLEEFEKGIVLKAVTDNKIIGSVRGFQDDDICYIGKLVVDAKFQNQGLGQMLMKEIEEAFPNVKRYQLFTGYKSGKNLYLYN